ncbi:MAG: sugar ABC transporter permease, partial [Chloroflexi bacterium]
MEDSLAGMARRRALLGYVFLLPTFLGILVFSAGPVIVSLGLSFFAWNV